MRPASSILPRAPRLSWLVLTPLVIAWTGYAPRPIEAASPEVHFDLVPLVACRDVTPEAFSALNPGEKLVEARVQVSALIRRGSEDDLLQFFYRLESPDRSLRIADYAPKTALASDQASNVTIENRREDSQHAGIALTSPADWPVKTSSSGDLGSKRSESTRYELVPQAIAVTVSGTLEMGHGVYFKLKPSRSSTLEGARQFTVVLRVPASWRGGSVHVSCTAYGVQRGVVRPLDEQIECGQGRFAMALYLEGDPAARVAAERLVRAETQMWQTVSVNRNAIRRSSQPSLLKQLGVLLDLGPQPTAADWTQQLAYGAPGPAAGDFAKRLPREVRQAVSQYTLARREMRDLAGVASTDQAAPVQ